MTCAFLRLSSRGGAFVVLRLSPDRNCRPCPSPPGSGRSSGAFASRALLGGLRVVRRNRPHQEHDGRNTVMSMFMVFVLLAPNDLTTAARSTAS